MSFNLPSTAQNSLSFYRLVTIQADVPEMEKLFVLGREIVWRCQQAISTYCSIEDPTPHRKAQFQNGLGVELLKFRVLMGDIDMQRDALALDIVISCPDIILAIHNSIPKEVSTGVYGEHVRPVDITQLTDAKFNYQAVLEPEFSTDEAELWWLWPENPEEDEGVYPTWWYLSEWNHSVFGVATWGGIMRPARQVNAMIIHQKSCIEGLTALQEILDDIEMLGNPV
ncbi:hypothetical protein BXZ70DRAFT_1011798 [Cristinia sonorae]|uniref:Uncharacterized protein n=1 Tax=Cristinia sonorae TaxID=1940300 RepID=A0A8K0UGF4_9AGAR|nr:hypothetical protein BXZ70DRAFT_1011798 [Cristinia sonorae]